MGAMMMIGMMRLFIFRCYLCTQMMMMMMMMMMMAMKMVMVIMLMPMFVCLVYVLLEYGDDVGHSGYGDSCTVEPNAYVKSFSIDVRAQLSQTLANQ